MRALAGARDHVEVNLKVGDLCTKLKRIEK